MSSKLFGNFLSRSSNTLKISFKGNLKSYSTKQSTRTLKSSIVPAPVIFIGGAIGISFGTYYLFDARSAIHEYVLCPLIRLLTDAEQGHRLGINLMKYGLVPRLYNDKDSEIISVEVFGKKLSNPIGVAAGLDKEGEAIDALYDCGFGYVEIGSITPEAQPGNPLPRFFRVSKDDAVINRYGFNSSGHWNVLARLRLRFEKFTNKLLNPYSNAFRQDKLLGINLGKNKTGDEVNDYVLGVQRLGQYADVLVINVSSPNTPGLRDLQVESKLTNLLTKVVEERNKLGVNQLGSLPPVLVKVAPDLTEPEIVSIASSAKNAKVDGIILGNTTIQRPLATMKTKTDVVNETGGLSGAPLKPISLKAFRLLRKHTKDSNLVLIGCGGISSGKDAIEFAKAGATFVQLYTAFAYKGPGLAAKIKDEITAELIKEGKTWTQIIGEDDK